MNNSNRQENNMQTTAITAIAAASATPFKTAFKIYMGMALASIATFAIILSGLTALVAFAFWAYS